MKKFLTVLLVVAVMFTFSFSSMAFAATVSKTGEEVEKALNTQIEANKTKLNSYKSVALLDLAASGAATKMDDKNSVYYGMYAISGVYYSEAAIVAAIDDIIAEAEDGMKTVKTGIMNMVSTTANTVEVASLTDLIDAVVKGSGNITQVALYAGCTPTSIATVTSLNIDSANDLLNAACALDDDDDYSMDETQVPLTLALYKEKLAAKADSYSETGKYTLDAPSSATATNVTSLTAKGVVSTVVENAIAEMDKVNAKTVNATVTNYVKLASFTNIYNGVGTTPVYKYDKAAGEWNITTPTSVASLTTAAQEEIDDAKDALDFEKAQATFKGQLLTFYEANKIAVAADSTTTYDLATLTNLFTNKNGIRTDKTSTANATLFGVSVANTAKATKAEAQAINAAFYAAVTTAADGWAEYADGDKDLLPAAVDGATFEKPMRAAVAYAGVEDYAASLKAITTYGEKKYDAEKIDKALASAKDVVYEDVMGTAPYEYYDTATGKATNSDAGFVAGVNKAFEKNLGASAALAYLEVEEAEAEAFREAVDDAADKFLPAAVTYGTKKTPAEDLVYCLDQYADYPGVTAAYAEIRDDALAALDDAQSYEEIESIMADAAAKLAALAPKADKTKMDTAANNDVDALIAYSASIQAAKGAANKYGQYTAAVQNAVDAIGDATTLDEIDAAYKAGLAAIEAVKTDDEIKADKKAVEAQVDALPYTAQITAADADAVLAAIDAYDEYKDEAQTEIDNKAALQAKAKAALQAKSEDLADAVKAAQKEVADLQKLAALGSEDAVAQLAAKEAELTALNDEVEAFNDKLDELADGIFDGFTPLPATVTDLEHELDLAKAAQAENAAILLVAANKPGATTAQKQAALDAYNALTPYQQMLVNDAMNDSSILEDIKADVAADEEAEKAAAVEAVEALKIKASSTAKKGSITVKWTVTGDEANVEGWEIWKSTKQSKGYKKAYTQVASKHTYKNTKGLKAGTRYYYKVRAIAYDEAGNKIKSDWSNKAYRVAK